MIEDYLRAAYYLDGLSECYFTDIYSLEGKPKRGLVLELEHDPYNIRCIELKTPGEEGDECSSYVKIRGKTIIPAVVRYKDHPLKRLRQLHKVTGIPYVSIIHVLVEFARNSKSITISSDAFNHTSIMIELGLAKYVNKGQDIQFIDDIPSL